MTEKLLQRKLIGLIKEEQFIQSINNVESLKRATSIDNDENYLPTFSIDSLLRKKYYKSAQRVVNSLYSYEFIGDENIRNISLKRGELLYPDCVLFNYERQQIILIECKVSGQTEREAITELFGYAHEIRNHLPFLSSFEINYIIISSEFSTLLDHSISGQVLSTHQNILCLRPKVKGKHLSFDIHFPKSWTDLGEYYLPKDGLVSYSICLSVKANLDPLFDYQAALHVAADILSTDGEKFNSSGFFILWKNAIKELGYFDYGISLYVLNPFSFLGDAQEKGFSLNRNSTLFRYLQKNKADLNTPSSLFDIPERALNYLQQYFTFEWDRHSTWKEDVEDELYQLQRLPLQFNSWGAIGDFVRYFYLHPAARKSYFYKAELNDFGYMRPFVGLQIINMISGVELFKGGGFFHEDIFQFGMQLWRYSYACQNAVGLTDDKTDSVEASLFWSVLPLLKSLKEISMRSNDLKEVLVTSRIPLYLNKRDVPRDWFDEVQKFAKWFSDDFLINHPSHKNAFIIGFSYGYYFSDKQKAVSPSSLLIEAKKIIAGHTHGIIKATIGAFLGKQRNFSGAVFHIIRKDFKLLKRDFKHFSSIKNDEIEFYSSRFLTAIKLLDQTIGEVSHLLAPFRMPKTVDFTGFEEKAKERFKEGRKFAVFEISMDGTLTLGQLNPGERQMGELQDAAHVFIKFSNGGVISIVLSTWEELKSGKYDVF